MSPLFEDQVNKIDYQGSYYYYEQMPSPIKDGLNYEQAKAIKSVLERAIKVPSKKLIDIEVTFWFFKRFYLVLYLGLDKRKTMRLIDDHSIAAIIKYSLHTVITLILWVSTLFVLFAALYYAKSTIGIDIFPEQHLQDIIKNY